MAKLNEYNGRFCESEYEYAFIGLLEKEGWKYLSGTNMPRTYKRDVLYNEDLAEFLSKTNKDLTSDEIIKLVDIVRLVGAESDFATLHKVYSWMVNGVQFKPKNSLTKMVQLIDFEKPSNNIFRVVNQLSVEYTNNGKIKSKKSS